MPDHSGTEQCAPDIVPEEAVRALRDKIIADITEKPCTRYKLASLLFSDAAECFPTGGSWGWDGAWFFLDLNTGSLSADVSTYPNQFGASREDSFPLSASEFHRIAEKKYFSPELRQFQTEEDWQRLFDSRLKAAVADAQAELRRQQEEKEEKEREAYAVRIPSGLAGRIPKMNIDRVDLGLIQMYGSSSLVLTRDGDTYSLSCVYGSRLSSKNRTIGRKANPAEAVWIEERVDRAVRNPDTSTWSSLPGGDIMNIEIRMKKHRDIVLKHVKPIKKYHELQSDLDKLVRYGSVIEDNAKEQDKKKIKIYD